MAYSALFVAVASLAGIAAFLFARSASAMNRTDTNEPLRVEVKRDSSNTPRGIRNNNPGNLEFVESIAWRGQIGSDGRYAIFDSALDGIRAMMIDLHTGFVRDGENTIREIIAEWAPPNENLTAAYMDSVRQQTGYGIDEPLSWHSAVIPLAKAITVHENGENPYTDSLFQDAYMETGRV